MMKRYLSKAEAFCWSLLYEYRCAADWTTGHILTMRINKWTKAVKVVEETVINQATASYRTA